ncbi:MAG TPA: energy transducer TonB [Saprospiraceae bacterium]|nr:energy transducer TonB [Saprospiraceae bacterium]
MNKAYKNTGISFMLIFVASLAYSQANKLADIPNRDPKDPVYSSVEKMPVLSGGTETMKMYIDYYPYPDCGLAKKIEGKVILQFIVEKNGEITGLKVLRSPDECLSKAAVEYLNQWPKWEPAKLNDKPVSCLFTLPIEYNIEQYNTRPK